MWSWAVVAVLAASQFEVDAVRDGWFLWEPFQEPGVALFRASADADGFGSIARVFWDLAGSGLGSLVGFECRYALDIEVFQCRVSLFFDREVFEEE